MILGRSTQHGWPADIDIFNGCPEIAVRFRDCLLEGIEVHANQVDGRDVVIGHHLLVSTAPTENSTMDLRMQGLDASVHHLRETGVITNFDDRNAMLDQQSCRTAC